MEKSIVQADFQLMDNYISEFSLNVFKKINNDKDSGINANIGFRIVNLDEKELVGQIELKYDIDITDNNGENVSRITIIMNGLFKGIGDIDKKDFEQLLKINGATTLSHLCRAYISSATALSGMPPINMPLINFYEFFKNAKKESNVLKPKQQNK